MLSLSDAMKTGRLSDFVAQEEERGVGPVNQTELEIAIKLMATSKPQEDQTSRSQQRGGSSGK